MRTYQSDRDFLERLEAVEERLAGLAMAIEGLTTPDAKSGEQWEDGQVWGHMTEFVPFWTGQIDHVIRTYQGDPVPFGRAQGSTARAEGIEAGLARTPEEQFADLTTQLADLRAWLQGMPENGLVSIGAHATMGEMAAWEAIDEFIISHLEQHADQLESITPDGGL
jgi:hypothetical protein